MLGFRSVDVPAPRKGGEKLVLAQGLALIFDLDGVIVDSMPMHQQAWRRYLESLRLDPEPILAGMHGQRNDEIVRGFLGAESDAKAIFEHGAAKERLFRDMLRGRLPEHLVPGLGAWLEHVANTPIALATNAERANVDFVLDGSALRPYFKVIVDGSQVDRPKPAPDVYLRAADLLRVLPRNCVVFEDSAIGVDAALAAGMRVVGVLTHSVALPGTHFSIHHFEEPALDTWLAGQTIE